MQHVVIVGGGPVGLFAAWRAAQFSNLHVTVLEKRDKYTRKQMALINKFSLRILPPGAVKKLFGPGRGKKGCYRLAPPTDEFSKCYTDAKNLLGSARIADLEEVLLEQVQTLKSRVVVRRGVTVTGGSVKTGEIKYLARNGTPMAIRGDVIVGADGAGSIVREKIMKTPFRVPRGLDTKGGEFAVYGAVFNFDKTPPGEGVQKIPSHRDLREAATNPTQQIYRFFRGRGSYYLGMAVEERFAADINKGIVPPELRPHLNNICMVVDPVDQGCHFNKLVDMAAFPIEIRRAKDPKKGKAFLVGDAAHTAHFFSGSGLNEGFRAVDSLFYPAHGRSWDRGVAEEEHAFVMEGISLSIVRSANEIRAGQREK